MSKTYRCRVKKDLSLTVDSRDSVTYRLRLGGTLPEDELTDILRAELEKLGGERQADGRVTLEVEGVTVEVDPAAREATLRGGAVEEIEASFDGEESSYSVSDDKAQAQRRAERRVEGRLRGQLASQQADREAAVRERLGQSGDRATELLREAAGRTESKAAVRRAERLGKVVGVTEDIDGETGDRTTVVEVELPGVEGTGARAIITHVFNPKTGKREWHIDYQSSPDLTRREHERAHRQLVRDLVGDDVLAGQDADVERGSGGSVEPGPKAAEQQAQPVRQREPRRQR